MVKKISKGLLTLAVLYIKMKLTTKLFPVLLILALLGIDLDSIPKTKRTITKKKRKKK